MAADRRPHPLAWWGWALGLAAAGLSCSNPVLLLGLCCVALLVAARCRSSAPWGGAERLFARMALLVVVLRLVFQVAFGLRLPGTVLFTTPSLQLPSWLAGVSLGGPVTAESLLAALSQGLRFAVVLLAFGAANAIVSPRELLRSAPAMASEAAIALSVALCFVPELLASMERVATARRLRGRPTKGLAGWRHTAVPVLEDALARSMALAASMATRGHGRRAPAHSLLLRRIGAAIGLLAVLALLLGGYEQLTATGPVPQPWLLLLAGAAGLSLAVGLGPRRAQRSRYRPPPFGRRSAACLVVGWLPLLAFSLEPASAHWSPWPLAWPQVAAACLLAVLLASMPIALHSPLPERRRPPRRELVG